MHDQEFSNMQAMGFTTLRPGYGLAAPFSVEQLVAHFHSVRHAGRKRRAPAP